MICDTLAEHLEEMMDIESNPVKMRIRIPVMTRQYSTTGWKTSPSMATLTIGMHWQIPDQFTCSIEAEDSYNTSGNFCISIDEFFAAEKDSNLLNSIERMDFTNETKKQIVSAIRQFINEGSK